MYRDRKLHPRVKDMQLPRLGKPRRGLQIFDTRVDFPVPVQSGGRFYYSPTPDSFIWQIYVSWEYVCHPTGRDNIFALSFSAK